MKATPEQIAFLNKLQEVDKMGLRAQRAIKQLPQPSEATQIREKRDGFAAKLQKVNLMLQREVSALEKLELEDRQLSEKISKVQEKIDSASGDYRNVNAWTKDMQSMSKRRQTLEGLLEEALTKISEVEQVKSQLEAAISQLEGKERALYESFQQESGKLKDDIVKCQEAGRLLAAQIPEVILKKYLNAVKACGGVGLAHLSNGRCDACRNEIPANRMPSIREEAPISECPLCHRVLVIE